MAEPAPQRAVRWRCQRSPLPVGVVTRLRPFDGLERIKATLLAINSADDERNPPELGVLDREIKRVKNGRILLIPGSESTAGHGTTGQAKFWKKELAGAARERAEAGATLDNRQ